MCASVDYVVGGSYLEAGGAPVHKLNGSFRFNGSDSGVYVFWNDVSSADEIGLFRRGNEVGRDTGIELELYGYCLKLILRFLVGKKINGKFLKWFSETSCG